MIFLFYFNFITKLRSSSTEHPFFFFNSGNLGKISDYGDFKIIVELKFWSCKNGVMYQK